jgi:hypothetical protein
MSLPPLVLFRDIHRTNDLLTNYDCKDSAPPPDQPGERARPGRNSQDGDMFFVGPVLFVLDLHIVHERWGSSSRLSVTSGLASNPANKEIASSSGASVHQDILFFRFFFPKNLEKILKKLEKI